MQLTGLPLKRRNFLPKLLLAPGHKGWPHFQRLLVALLRFLEPYLRNAELTEAVRILYKVGSICCAGHDAQPLQADTGDAFSPCVRVSGSKQ